MSEYQFVIGIGSQRAGSTFLFKLLNEASKDVYMHPIKELHYFDRLFGHTPWRPLINPNIDKILDFVNKLKEKPRDLSEKELCWLFSFFLRGYCKLEDVKYLDLFFPILKKHKLLGEITPEYMLLSNDEVRKMKDIIGEDSKIILICRNPVKRIISSMKLRISILGIKLNGIEINSLIRNWIENDHKFMKQQDMFNDYERAIEIYSKFFKNFLVLSFDDLVSNPEKTGLILQEKLGIIIDLDKYKELTKTKVNTIEIDINLSDEILEILTERYKKVDDFLQSYFGKKLIL